MSTKLFKSHRDFWFLISLHLVAVAFFILDRLLKSYWHHQGLFYPNPGVAFGVALNNVCLWLIVLVILAVAIILLVRAYLYWQPFVIAAFTLIIFGAASNLYDRWLWGYVVDYIHWPFSNVFNLADTLILLGVAILAFKIFRPTPRLKNT